MMTCHCEHGVPYESGVCNACFPTDHPSNPPSQEPTLEQIKAASDLLMPNKSYMNSDAFSRVVMAVASALAAQEARHKAEMNESHETNRLAISAQRALSNLEHKTRLELRETESKLLRLHSILAWYEEKHQQRLKQVYEAESKFLEAQAHVRNHHLEACETCIANESTTLALESKLREATEREKALREALKSLMNDDGSSASLPAHDTRCVLALAAIRSGPAQQAAETPLRKAARQLRDRFEVVTESTSAALALDPDPLADPPEQETPRPEREDCQSWRRVGLVQALCALPAGHDGLHVGNGYRWSEPILEDAPPAHGGGD